jgi:hypothetical protein
MLLLLFMLFLHFVLLLNVKETVLWLLQLYRIFGLLHLHVDFYALFVTLFFF